MMKDEREDPRRKRSPDSRIEYGQVAREDEPEPSPAPYDLAPPGTPDDQIIRKGERERPGPTADEVEDDAYDREDERAQRADGLSPDDLEASDR
jgi:hypothetical protein